MNIIKTLSIAALALVVAGCSGDDEGKAESKKSEPSSKYEAIEAKYKQVITPLWATAGLFNEDGSPESPKAVEFLQQLEKDVQSVAGGSMVAPDMTPSEVVAKYIEEVRHPDAPERYFAALSMCVLVPTPEDEEFNRKHSGRGGAQAWSEGITGYLYRIDAKYANTGPARYYRGSPSKTDIYAYALEGAKVIKEDIHEADPNWVRVTIQVDAEKKAGEPWKLYWFLVRREEGWKIYKLFVPWMRVGTSNLNQY